MEPLSFFIVYAILTTATSISANLASSTIFEMLKPKIFKKKDFEEIQEALQQITDDLKEKGYEKEWKELEQKISDITEKTLESSRRDFHEMREEIVSTITRAVRTQEHLDAVEELKRTVLEYDLPPPYEVFTKEAFEKAKVVYRPPFEVEPVERHQNELVADQNIFIIGKPGVGKTFSLYQVARRMGYEKVVWIKPYVREDDITRLLREDLPHRTLLVWDDVQNSAEIFYKAVYRLSEKVNALRVLSAARSTELEKLEKIPVTFWDDFGFLQKDIPPLDLDERRELIGKCSEKTGITISGDVADALAGKSDGTPLYVVSVFLDEHYRKEGRILLGDVETLPANVVEMWAKYFRRLKENEKAVLRCLSVLAKVEVRAMNPLVEKLYLAGGGPYDAFCDALEGLKEQGWVVDAGHGYECHDVQLEAVPFGEEMLSHLKEFMVSADLDAYSDLLLSFGISLFYGGRIGKTRDYRERNACVMEAIRFVERALRICRGLGLKAELSASLNNASNLYSNLSSLQQTREDKLKSIETALRYIEEAVEIRRDLGLKAELSASLNNASLVYFTLSTYEDVPQEKKESLISAITHIGEAIEIRKNLGLLLERADSLAVSVLIYDAYVEFDSTVFSKAMDNCDQAIDIFLGFSLKEKYCPLLLLGIRYHQLLFTVTKSPEHQSIIKKYHFLLHGCR